MSAGIGAKACLAEIIDDSVIYKYYSFNLNDINRKEKVFDGRIILNKRCFNEYKNLSIIEMIYNREIIIENCSNCWTKSNDEFKFDMMALRILNKMFNLYFSDNKIPEEVFYCC